MKKPVKRRSKKIGLPPGTLIHIGEKKAETTKITLFDFDELHCIEKEIKVVAEAVSFKDSPALTWINVDGLHEVEVVRELGDCFGLHPLVLEDILNTDHRPKTEDYETYIFIILNMLYYDESTDGIVPEQCSLVFGRDFVLSFQEREGDVFNPIRERIRNGKGRLRKMGPDYLAYALLDAIVDHYFLILEKLGEKIERIEERLLESPTGETAHAVHHLKREMISLRRSVWPLREVISGLQRGEPSLIQKSTMIYLRDVYDHTIQVIDTVETFRDMLSGMLDIYLTSVSNRMNEVMKVLTIIATIFIPITFIAGVYGMNFKYMPELEWRWGYPMIWLVIFVIAIVMLFFFRRKRWM